jgi:hypothetical protein
MNLSTADLRNYRTEFHETWWSYRYMFLVDPNKNKNNNKKRSKNNKSPKLCLGDLIIRNGAKTISPSNFVWET